MVEGFTKRYGVHQLVWYEVHESMESAIEREKQLKEWKRKWKLELIEGTNPNWKASSRRKSGTTSKTGSRFSPGTLDSGFRRNDATRKLVLMPLTGEGEGVSPPSNGGDRYFVCIRIGWEENPVEEDIGKFLYEMGQLKRVKRSGWWIAGVKDPESVAEHSFRTAVIAYILAQLEGADLEKVISMALFHDMPEARTNDAHRIVRRYVNWENVDRKAAEEQSKRLPDDIAERITSVISEYEGAVSLEALVVRDADLLECLVQAREYQALGYNDVVDWIFNAQAALKTKSAKKIAAACLKTEPKAWWQGLKAHP